MRTYDDHQREAIYVLCVRCRRWWYMTLANFVCQECR